jgi:hypothetical protein
MGYSITETGATHVKETGAANRHPVGRRLRFV